MVLSTARVRGVLVPSIFSQAANPCEWVLGLGWRSHPEATPGGLDATGREPVRWGPHTV
jgi:hypothetical protein